MTEYAIMLFLVAVVAGTGFKFFGQKLQGGVGKAGSNLATPDTRPAADSAGAGAGGTSLTTSHGASATGNGDPTAVYGGPRTAPVAQEGTPFAKFAMIALGIIGAAVAFFAAMKGKHAR